MTQQIFNLNISRKRLDRLAIIADDEAITVKQLLLRLIDEAWEDYEAGDDDDDGLPLSIEPDLSHEATPA
jgi:hypothetical protein